VRLYADTSWWFALKCRRDTHHAAAVSLFDREPEAEVLWTPWQRVEVFNSFRRGPERAGRGGGSSADDSGPPAEVTGGCRGFATASARRQPLAGQLTARL